MQPRRYRYTDFRAAWNRYLRQLHTHAQTLRASVRDASGKAIEWELVCHGPIGDRP